MEQLDLGVKKTRRCSHEKRQFFLGGILLLLCMLGTSGLFLYRAHQREGCIKQAREAYSLRLYQKAITYYEKSLTYNPKNEVDLVLELSSSYNALGRYEDAAKFLQKYYKKTGDAKLKKSFNTTIDLITEEQYEQSMNRGRLYLESEIYDKALQEYKEAYRICPQKQDVVTAIILTYLKSGKVEQAKEFYQGLMGDFNEESLSFFKKLIDESEINSEYDRMLEEAEEAFYEENYEGCFKLYRKAIKLLPDCITAYEKMVDAYLSRRDYDVAVDVIQQYERKYKDNKELVELKNSIYFRKEEEERLNTIMKKLYKEMDHGNIPYVLDLVKSSYYKKWVTGGNTYYYDAVAGYRSLKFPMDRGIVIYSNGYIYCGDFENGKRSGNGRLFGLQDNNKSHFLFTGEWKADMPEGEGVLNTIMKIPQEDEIKEYKVTVQGQFVHGLENGSMRRDFYFLDHYYGTLEYNCINGIPQPRLEELLNPKMNVASLYSIGKFVTIEGTQEFPHQYTLDRWGVPGF